MTLSRAADNFCDLRRHGSHVQAGDLLARGLQQPGDSVWPVSVLRRTKLDGGTGAGVKLGWSLKAGEVFPRGFVLLVHVPSSRSRERKTMRQSASPPRTQTRAPAWRRRLMILVDRGPKCLKNFVSFRRTENFPGEVTEHGLLWKKPHESLRTSRAEWWRLYLHSLEHDPRSRSMVAYTATQRLTLTYGARVAAAWC